ncbi:MAG: metal ABC transporter permease [Spirochaetaceae bacterium]|jgi:zinc transport system permease protein|nr:metal ABC transporter permease [Spirochaetaceae bacterium]
MFSFAFIQRAVIVGFLVSLCASLLGVSLVLKRYSMIGDGLSHVGFATLAVATALNMAPLTVSIPVVVASAFFLLRLSEHSKIRGDAAIALFSTGALAIGVMVISVTTGMNVDVCNYLFGSILAMSKADVRLSIVLSAAVIFLFVIFYNKIFAVTFDENFARATGVRAGLYNMVIALLTAVTIVLGMRMMGALLISSLIIFPALSSMRLFKSFRAVTISSAVISVSCFFAGIVISYVFATPTGASIVVFNILLFILFSLIEALRRGSRRRNLIRASAAALTMMALGCSRSPVLNTPQNMAGTRSVELAEAEKTAFLTEQDGEIDAGEPKEGPSGVQSGIIEIKEKMFIAQTNDVYLNPEDYLGKTIKLEGLFKIVSYEDMSRIFCFVLRNGPGCCGNDGSVGFEVSWPEASGVNSAAPLLAEHEYPRQDQWVQAVGTLAYYEEEGYPYLYLALDSLVVKQSRGKEFVSQ